MSEIALRGIFADPVAWVFACFFAGFFRFEFQLKLINFESFFLLALVAATFQVVLGLLWQLYRDSPSRASFDEFLILGLVTSTVVSVTTIALMFVGQAAELPRSIMLIAGAIFIVLGAAWRASSRLLLIVSRRSEFRKRAIIYGAGSLGSDLVPQLLSDSSRRFLPVAIVDDDPGKLGTWVSGIRTAGSLADLPRLIRQKRIETIIIAVPRADSKLLQAVTDIAESTGTEVVVMPSFGEILDGDVGVRSLKTLEIAELVGRRGVQTDSGRIREFLEGKVVLVTGAGGSIGIEICRQVMKYAPGRLVYLDRDETGLQNAQLAAKGWGLLDGDDFALVDIRSKAAVERVFLLERPHVVFHAAALKHLPALEKFPEEAWQTNVLGTLNVLEAAHRSGVDQFVNISTDKAAEPVSILGLSKKIAEELTAWFSSVSEGNFVSVRFGNVLGSRGSLIPTLKHLIETESQIVLTDPHATRYFMTISEASKLVLQAGVEKERRAILILDMGQPLRISEIAERMIEMSGREINVTYRGLRPGEKLHETLVAENDILESTSHPLISRAYSDILNPADLGQKEVYFVGEDRENGRSDS